MVQSRCGRYGTKSKEDSDHLYQSQEMKAFLNQCLHSYITGTTTTCYLSKGVGGTILFLMIGLPLSLWTLLVLNSFRRMTQSNNTASLTAFKSMASATANSASTDSSCPAASPSSPAALIFLHGLGDTPTGWSSLQSTLPSLRASLAPGSKSGKFKFEYVFPPAPIIASTINGGRCIPGWFDLYDWPITLKARDDREGILHAVAQVEKEVKKLQERGIPKSRIVVGGFSQGGAIALQTVYRSSERFCACVALSGWLTLRNDLVVSEEAKKTPLFWGHGDHDDKVLFEQQFFGVKMLREQGVQVTKKAYQMGHQADPEEINDMAAFLDLVLHGEAKDAKVQNEKLAIKDTTGTGRDRK
jgi:lysophospholipase-2